MQNTILTVEGYHLDTPNLLETVNVSLGSWSGIEDYIDDDIFFYTDGEPVSVGSILSDDFVVTAIEED